MIIYTDFVPLSQNQIYPGSIMDMVVMLPGQDLK
jgi:hypothetical protein